MNRKWRYILAGVCLALAALGYLLGNRLSACAPQNAFPVLGAFGEQAWAALPGALAERPFWLSGESADVLAGGLAASMPLAVWALAMCMPHPDRTDDAYGSERRGRVAELRDYTNVADEASNIVLSQNGRVSLKGDGTPERRGGRVKTANSNVMVVGGSGARKTTSVLEPNLLQGAAGCDKDTVSTDPKGATPPRVGHALVKGGRDVLVLNLVDLGLSSVWNPLSIIQSYTDVERVSNALVHGASPDGHSTSEPIWDNGAAALCAIIISYLWAWRPETDHTMANVQLLLSLCDFSGGTCGFDVLVDELESGTVRGTAAVSGKGRGAVGGTNSQSALIRRVDCAEEEAGTPAGQFAYDYTVASWRRFRSGAPETLGSFKATLSQAISVFCSPDVLRVLGSSNDGIDEIRLGDLGVGERRRDIFIVSSDRDHTLQPVLSLFVWEAMYVSGRNADAQPDRRVPHHVQFLIDELYAVGELPDFAENVVTVRSRNISVLFCIQNLSQLDERYGEHGAKTIMDSCASKVYLAGADSPDTCKRLEEMMGQMTVRKNSESLHNKGLPGKDVSQDVVGRPVFTAQELARMNPSQCVVKVGAGYWTQDEKTRVWEHPAYDPLAMYDPNGKAPEGARLFDYVAYREAMEGTSEHAAKLRREERAERERRRLEDEREAERAQREREAGRRQSRGLHAQGRPAEGRRPPRPGGGEA